MYGNGERLEKYFRLNDPFRQADPEESELAYLLQNSKTDDLELLERLVGRYAAGVQRWVDVLLFAPGKDKSSQEEVRLILVNIFVNAFQHAEQFHGQASLTNWLYAIAYQVVGRYKRQQILKKSLRGIDVFCKGTVQTNDAHAAYWESVDRLSDKIRLPLILRYMFELEISDIAYILDIPEKAIHRHLSTARHRLLVNPTYSHLHKQIQANLDGYLDDDLTALSHMDDHLTECPVCQEYAQKVYGLEKRLATGLKERWILPVQSSDDLIVLVEDIKLKVRKPQARWRVKLPIRQIAWITGLGLTFIGLAVIFVRLTPVEREFPFLAPPTTVPLPPIIPMASGITPSVGSTGSGELSFVSHFIEPDFSSDRRWGVFASIGIDPVTQAEQLPIIYVYDRETNSFQTISDNTEPLYMPWMWWNLAPSISADGRWIAYVSSTNDPNVEGFPCKTVRQKPCLDIFLYNRETGMTMRITKGLNGEAVDGDSFSPTVSGDGQWIAFWSAASNLAEGDDISCQQGDTIISCLYIYLYSLQTGEITRIPIGTTPREGIVSFERISLSADGRLVGFTITSEDQVVAQPGISQFNLSSLDSSLGVVSTNTSILPIEHATEAVVYDRETDQYEMVNQTGDGTAGNGASFSPVLSADGSFVAFISVSTNLVEGDTNSYSDVFVRDRESGSVELVSISSDGRQGTADSGLSFWGRGYYALNISDDGRFVVFESEAMNLGQELNPQCNLFGMAMCNMLYVHDRQTGITEWVSALPNGDFSLYPDISTDGRWVTFMKVVGDCDLLAIPCSEVMLYDRQRGWTTNLTHIEASTPKTPWEYSSNLVIPEEAGFNKAIVFSPDGTLLASGGMNGRVIVWQITKGNSNYQAEQVFSLEGETRYDVISLAFSPDGEWLAAGSSDGVVNIWDVQDGRRLYALAGHLGPVQDVIFTPDGTKLLAGTPSTIWIWQIGVDVVTRVGELTYDSTGAYDIELSPRGDLLAAARGDGTVWLQSLPSGQVIARLGGHEVTAIDLAFSADGSLLASRSLEGTVDLWQIGWTGVGTPSVTPLNIFQPEGWIGEMSFSPDNKYLASAGYAGGVVLWNVSDGNISTLSSPVPMMGASCLAFSKDGNLVAAYMQDKVILWAVPAPYTARYFVNSAVDAFVDSAPLPVATANDIPQFQIPPGGAGDEHLNLYQAGSLLPSPFLIPTHLPENITFQEARRMGVGGVRLQYEVAITQGVHATLYILEETLGSSNVPTMTIGPNADVSGVQIETSTRRIPAEYTRGDWILTQTYTPLDNGALVGGEAHDIWLWDIASDSQRLRWQQDGMLIAIYYQVYDTWQLYDVGTPIVEGPTQGNNFTGLNLILDQEDILQIASGMERLPAGELGGRFLIPYIVQAGDTCTSIATYFGSNISAITAQNALDQSCDVIFEGQSVLIPINAQYQPWEDIDMDCDGRLERLEILPMPNTDPTDAVFGINMKRLNDIGIYQSVWQVSIADGSALRLSLPEVFTTDTCGRFLSFSVVGGNDPGLKVFRWQDGEMQMIQDDPGSPWIAPNGIATTITAHGFSGDSSSGSCSSTTSIYTWDGQTFVLTSQNNGSGGDCSTPLPSTQENPSFMLNGSIVGE